MNTRDEDPKPDRAGTDAGVQGEGNPAADARYRKATKAYLDENDPEQAAEKAREELRGEGGDELRAAEAEGKARRRSEER